MKKLLILFLLSTFIVFSQNSMNMNLLGSYNYPNTEGSDIWGWVDTSGNEFALVCLRNGFSVVNVTSPTNPFEEFFISDINSIWRDVKTWGNYAYVTTEANAGLLIVDLSDMSGSTYSHVSQFSNTNGNSTSFTSAHNIYIDENGIAYIFGAGGSGSQSDGVIFLDVNSSPMNPIYLGEWDQEYIHDGMVRGDTLWAGCIYDGKLYAIDVSDKSNPITLGSKSTPNNFTHNAWISEDGDYVFTTDEQSDAYLAAYDVTNLSNIQEVDRIQSNPGSNSIPHNTHVDGNFLITSYYRDGTTVHDITHPNHMIEVAFYDSYSGSGNGFDGCWGTYPFLPSGNIISSEINSGSNGSGQLLIFGRDFLQACYLKGNVYDAISNMPINNATIQLLNTSISQVSNLVGFYQTASISSGSFQVVFSANGYISDTLSVMLNNGVMTILDAYLFPPCNATSLVNNFVEICNDSVYVIGNSIYQNSGSYFDTLIDQNGCDSIINTMLTVFNSFSTNNLYSICDGDSLIIGNSIYSVSGNYVDSLITINGCDSIINTSLDVSTNSSIFQSFSICDGDSIIVGNNIYYQSGLYTDIYLASNGCDSLVMTDVIVNSSYIISNNVSICEGEDYIVGNSIYTLPGSYIDILTSINGCDSVVMTSLTVNPTSTIINDYIICIGDSIQIGSIFYSVGEYFDTLSSMTGCDSIIISNISYSDPIVNFNSYGSQLIGQVNFGIPPFTYYLYGPNGLITTLQNNGSVFQYIPIVNGIYSFVVVDDLGCISDTLNIYVDWLSTSINNKKSIENLSIYPNPAFTDVNITLDLFNSENLYITIYNILSEKIFQYTNTNVNDTEFNIQIDISEFKTGIYLIDISDGVVVKNRKLIVEK